MRLKSSKILNEHSTSFKIKISIIKPVVSNIIFIFFTDFLGCILGSGGE